MRKQQWDFKSFDDQETQMDGRCENWDRTGRRFGQDQCTNTATTTVRRAAKRNGEWVEEWANVCATCAKKRTVGRQRDAVNPWQNW